MSQGRSRFPGPLRTAALLAAVAVLAPGLVTVAPGAERARSQTQLRAFVGSVETPPGAGRQVVVEQDIDAPDMAIVTLSGTAGLAFAGGVTVGADLSVVAAPSSPAAVVFKGEIVGVEPVFDPLNPHVVIRAYNRLQRLAGEPQTRLFTDVTEGEIVTTLAQEHGLVPVPDPELQERHETVYQHNQTDLEFLRARAARIGYQVWCEDTKLFFQKAPATRPVVLAPTRARGDAVLRRFHPRLATSETVQRVIVRGWDPVRRAIVGEASAATRLLRPEPNTPGLLLGRTATYTVDHPIFSVAEARAIAAGTLGGLLAAQFDAEAETGGTDSLRPGRRVAVQGMNDRFDGKYLVRGVSHRYSHPDTCGQGYRSLLRLEHAAPALFFLPEVNDEVLVAFEHGDLGRPYVVGSLWGDDDDACSARTRR